MGDDLGVRFCRGKTGRGVEGLMARLPILGAGAIATGVAFVPGLAHIRFACQYSFSCSSRCRLAYAAGFRLYCEPIVGMTDNASLYSSLVGWFSLFLNWVMCIAMWRVINSSVFTAGSRNRGSSQSSMSSFPYSTGSFRSLRCRSCL